MPTLFVSSHYSLDSRRLRTAAESTGWRVSRVDHPSEESLALSVRPYAIFAPPGHAVRIAADIRHQLLACEDDWLPSLPPIYRRRAISRVEYSVAKEQRAAMFIKPARKGLFPAGVYRPGELKSLGLSILSHAPVYFSEPVRWKSEFRCFIANREITAMAPYRVGEETLTHLDDRLPVTQDECDEARLLRSSPTEMFIYQLESRSMSVELTAKVGRWWNPMKLGPRAFIPVRPRGS